MPSSQEYTSISPLSPEGFTQFQRAIEDLPASVLRSEVERLHNSTFHLRRSNTELLQAAQEDDGEELHEYIIENEDVIRANTIKISLLQNQLRQVEASHPHEIPTESTTDTHTDLNGSAVNGSAVADDVADGEGVFL